MNTQIEQNAVVGLVDTMIERAIDGNASDIHFEPNEKNLRIRFRIDGVLYDKEGIAKTHMHQITSRLKVLANINIAEKRIPQDGKFRLVRKHREIDVRVSTFPSLWGEKIVLRILDHAQQAINLEQLGFDSIMLEQFKQLIHTSNGFFLVCGPTGSGKTTTLYAALSSINKSEHHIITLEDPIEYNIPGITQGQIHPDAGFTFEKGMRALLRQDPDIVMVGEIRDTQTAAIAIQAALTGHLVMSTLHTNDACSVIMRLMDMGIEPFLINAALTGVLAQRLARKICNLCKQEYKPTDHDHALMKKLGVTLDTLYKGKGCDACLGLGYKGRIGIFQLLMVTNQLRSLMVQQPSYDAINSLALSQGMQSLIDDGASKVKTGIITLHELIRVVV
jgi:type II secretory ATPase GspE/PulE/Tfp pilus assembly ATPase PilB-like protein